MPIRNHVEAIVHLLNENLGFAYGTANELNLTADSTIFPCAFMYPLQPVILSPQINGAVDNTYTVSVLQREVTEIKKNNF
ncbi:hypothetical protein EOD41_15160 [Mucilaginibacter limnophilus]|uniref:Uncharacterized protein n=1 Tax=Mucilaginibacter limnophilus TaxID=1932778 RepID=A0A437MQ47_9SPHI|nr:hypothetical protein [Mucilaginibacter limnophilus]RVT99779.1 hypothetical protein EOD41_15160 [Mucilaginibacter limnophilus]